jgi:hypothetical protein
LVAPIVARTTSIAFGPARVHGRRGDVIDQTGVEGLPRACVVLLASSREMCRLHAGDAPAAAFQAVDDLAGQPRCAPSGLTMNSPFIDPRCAGASARRGCRFYAALKSAIRRQGRTDILLLQVFGVAEQLGFLEWPSWL